MKELALLSKNHKQTVIKYKSLTMHPFSKLLILCLISISLSACYSIRTNDDWPTNIPSRKIFVDAYHQQAAQGNNSSDLNTHLTWVKRFYRGLSIYPGWNDMTKLVLDNLADEPIDIQNNTAQRLSDLGKKICIEWAQSNDSRNIDSANINTWGVALRKSVKQKQIFPFLAQVEKDVDALIARELDIRAITSDRYYPDEDYDDF